MVIGSSAGSGVCPVVAVSEALIVGAIPASRDAAGEADCCFLWTVVATPFLLTMGVGVKDMNMPLMVAGEG
jgi:hypothetical protein